MLCQYFPFLNENRLQPCLKELIHTHESVQVLFRAWPRPLGVCVHEASAPPVKTQAALSLTQGVTCARWGLQAVEDSHGPRWAAGWTCFKAEKAEQKQEVKGKSSLRMRKTEFIKATVCVLYWRFLPKSSGGTMAGSWEGPIDVCGNKAGTMKPKHTCLWICIPGGLVSRSTSLRMSDFSPLFT